MGDIWEAAETGDLGGVEWLVEQDPGLLNARDGRGGTPLMCASAKGHVEVVRWLLDKGAAINERDDEGGPTALELACYHGSPAVVRLLVVRGADPTNGNIISATALMFASSRGHLEVVRLLLDHPSARATINERDTKGRTALWWACHKARGVVARLLLENGADPIIVRAYCAGGGKPMAAAKDDHFPEGVTAEGRRKCVAALEVRTLSSSPSLLKHLLSG
jgi:uncharacterized protein